MMQPIRRLVKMPTPQQLKVHKDLKQQLARKGIDIKAIDTPAPRAQWWKPAGENSWVQMPNLLPADPYHTQLYMAKGYTLIPPDPGTLVPYAPTVEQAKEYGIPIRGVVLEAAPPAPRAVAEEPDPGSLHKHTYSSKKAGAQCVLDGCTTTRQEPFKGRLK